MPFAGCCGENTKTIFATQALANECCVTPPMLHGRREYVVLALSISSHQDQRTARRTGQQQQTGPLHEQSRDKVPHFRQRARQDRAKGRGREGVAADAMRAAGRSALIHARVLFFSRLALAHSRLKSERAQELYRKVGHP